MNYKKFMKILEKEVSSNPELETWLVKEGSYKEKPNLIVYFLNSKGEKKRIDIEIIDNIDKNMSVSCGNLHYFCGFELSEIMSCFNFILKKVK
jgi:hypothetical protein